jgi:mannosyltransferase OCH1-like enzyme
MDNRKWVIDKVPSFLDVYDSFDAEIYRVDMVRPLYLFFKGGFYIDLDCIPLNYPTKLLESNAPLIGRMGSQGFIHSIPNAIMGSPRHCVFWLFYLGNMIKRQSRKVASGAIKYYPEFSTGPVMLMKCVSDYNRVLNGDREELEWILNYTIKHNGLDSSQLNYAAPTIVQRPSWYPLDWSNKKDQLLVQKIRNESLEFSDVEAKAKFPESDFISFWSHSWGGLDIGKKMLEAEIN